MKRWLFWVPLVVFALLMAVVATGLLRPADTTVRSALIGRPLPDIALPPMLPDKAGIDPAAFRRGQPRLLNVFASWCIPCIAEAPQLLRLKAMGIPIDAIALRDTPMAIRDFLARNGDPYDRVGNARDGAVQMALGSSGVPETFVIDGRGRVVMQHIGDIRADDVARIAAAVREAR